MMLTISCRLDSRQRKKQHTERLEEEKKTYTTIITELEERVAELEIREGENLRAQEQWTANQQRYEHYVETLMLEKEEMVRRHTLETGDLRKKNAFLTEHMQKLESTAMSAVPSSSGFSSNDFSDIDSLTMEGGSWDHFSFLNDFAVEAEPQHQTQAQPPPQVQPQQPQQQPHNSLIARRKMEKTAMVSDAETPATSGLLLVVSFSALRLFSNAG